MPNRSMAHNLVNITSAEQDDEVDIHIKELQRRRLGYAFGGPDPAWCSPAGKGAILLPAPSGRRGRKDNLSRYTGCLKYATCDLIPDRARWRRWEELTAADQEFLRSIHCYRASTTDWDIGALESRQNRPDGKWIANPFGLRTTKLDDRVEEGSKKEHTSHRDLSPCPVGGCITPEIQRAYESQYYQVQPSYRDSNYWRSNHACPYYFRHTDHQLKSAIPNPQRFTQCYVNMPRFRAYLRGCKLIVSAPIFRSSQRTESLGETFWYSFYSGFAYLQLPTSNPSDQAEIDLFAPLRWQATTLARLQNTRALVDTGTQRIFQGAELGDYLSSWERQFKVVSISEGQTSAVLLQWVIARRLLFSLKSHVHLSNLTVDIYGRMRWLYEEDNQIVRKLFNMGYKNEIGTLLGVDDNGGAGFFRNSMLLDDLALLGLVDSEGQPTERVDCAAKWLIARVKEVPASKQDNSLSRAVQEWLGIDGIRLVRQLVNGTRFDRLHNLCRIMSTTALRHLGDLNKWPAHIKVRNPEAAIQQIMELDNPAKNSYASISRLLPPIHILVRSGWKEPLRWMFIPLTSALAESESSDSQPPRLRVQSGIIAVFLDDPDGLPYSSNSQADNDSVLSVVSQILPLLAFTSTIEEELIRETLINSQEWFDTYTVEIGQLHHTISAIQRHMAESPDIRHQPLRLLLRHLEAHFTAASPTPSLARISVSVDIREAMKEAVDAFNAYYKTYKLVTAELELAFSQLRACVTLLHGYYSHEQIGSLQMRAQSQLVVLLLDLLVQRYRAKGGLQQHLVLTCVPEGADRIVFRVQLNSPFDTPVEWDSRKQSLDFFPRNRGFYSTFSLARALGSLWQEVRDVEGKGEIAVAFPKAGEQ
jgi:hypothetical protein